MNDNLQTVIIKSAIMLGVLVAEYWVMTGPHENYLSRVWYYLARVCYSAAAFFGGCGLAFEHEYYEAV